MLRACHCYGIFLANRYPGTKRHRCGVDMHQTTFNAIIRSSPSASHSPPFHGVRQSHNPGHWYRRHFNQISSLEINSILLSILPTCRNFRQQTTACLYLSM